MTPTQSRIWNKRTPKPAQTHCVVCGEVVDRTPNRDEEFIFLNGELMHEDCHDVDECRRENAAEIRDGGLL